MSSTKQKRVSVAELLRVKASQTLESHTYIKLYSKALESHMEINQRQSFFMIAKMLTDGTMALNKNQSRLANYYFELSEKYINQIPNNQKNYLNFIKNVYGRSKSFHHFKLGKIDKTVELVENCLEATVDLEQKEGLEFLILDRISQYDNLSRVYFATDKTIEGFEILTDCIVFLMTGKSNERRKLHNKYLKDNNEDYFEMRSHLIFTILSNTIIGLQKERDKEKFVELSLLFLSPIFQNLKNMNCFTEVDSKVKNWLEIIQNFYTKEIFKFKKLAIPFINSPQEKKDKKLANITSSFFNYC